MVSDMYSILKENIFDFVISMNCTSFITFLHKLASKLAAINVFLEQLIQPRKPTACDRSFFHSPRVFTASIAGRPLSDYYHYDRLCFSW